MPRDNSPDIDQHYYSDRRGRYKDDYHYDKYSKSHQQMTHRHYERYYGDPSSSSHGRSRSRSHSRYSSKKTLRRSQSRSKYDYSDRKKSRSRSRSDRRRSRSRTKYDYHSKRKSRSRSHSNKRKSRSRSYSRHSKRSRSRNSPKHRHYRRSTERSDSRRRSPSPSSSMHLSEASNVKIQNVKDSVHKNQNYQKMKSTENNNYTESNNDDSYDNYVCNTDADDGNDDELEPTEKEKIHRQIEEKLRETLAKEGKVYPPRKNEASHPIFANDGSFLEVFKKMQEQANNQNNQKQNQLDKSNVTMPAVSKRRGGRILKTGVVAKPSARNDGSDNSDPKDFWSLYLEEVKKYKNATCDIDGKTRPLVK